MGRRKALPPDFDGNYTEEMLSERQRAILNYVREFIGRKGYPPAVREIGLAVGLSSSASVHNHLKNLASYKEMLLNLVLWNLCLKTMHGVIKK